MFPFIVLQIGAGGGIRTHEGLRHGIAHPRFARAASCCDAFAVLGLECSARMLGATRPFSQMIDLTLVPPQRETTSLAFSNMP